MEATLLTWLIVLVTTAQSGHDPFCSLAVLLSFVFKPDLFLGVEGVRLTTIVFDVGWSQSHPQLIAAKNLWLQGGANEVNAVLVNERDVKGVLEVFRRGGTSEGHDTPEMTASVRLARWKQTGLLNCLCWKKMPLLLALLALSVWSGSFLSIQVIWYMLENNLHLLGNLPVDCLYQKKWQLSIWIVTCHCSQHYQAFSLRVFCWVCGPILVLNIESPFPKIRQLSSKNLLSVTSP